MIDSGFIKIHRSMLKWEWYTDSNTKALFFHLLLTVNWEPRKWRGITIEKGQRVCSLATLSQETSLSVQSIRTALNHLKSTGEITDEATRQYRIITVKNYGLYQSPTDDLTDNQQTGNRRPTDDQQQLKNIKEIQEGKEKESVREKFTPPSLQLISDYCLSRKSSVDPQRFLDYYTANGWRVGKNPMRDWKAAVRTWEGKEVNRNGGNGQAAGAGEAPPSRWNIHSELDGL